MFFGMARQLTPLLALHLAQQRLKQEQSRSVLDQVNPNRHDDPLLAQLSKPTTQPEIESFPWSRSYQAEEGPSLYDARGKPVRTVYSQLGLPEMYGRMQLVL